MANVRAYAIIERYLSHSTFQQFQNECKYLFIIYNLKPTPNFNCLKLLFAVR